MTFIFKIDVWTSSNVDFIELQAPDIINFKEKKNIVLKAILQCRCSTQLLSKVLTSIQCEVKKNMFRMLSGEAKHTNFIIFGLTEPGLEPRSFALEVILCVRFYFLFFVCFCVCSVFISSLNLLLSRIFKN
jgi:hypothetical protein